MIVCYPACVLRLSFNNKVIMSLKLPKPPIAVGEYRQYIKAGCFVCISGQIPIVDGVCDESVIGKLGDNLSIEDGQNIARICTLNMLAQLNDACGLDEEVMLFTKVKQCVKINVFVNCTVDFYDHSLIANAASSTIVEYLGEARGKHARAAIGVSQLPKGVAVEVDGVFEIASF